MDNMILGKKYTVSTGVPIANSFATTGNERSEGLTDEVSVSLNYGDSCWSKFYRGMSRSIIVPLDGEFAVDGFEITFLQNKSAGIYTPRTVELYVSENGRDFMPAYTVESLVAASEPAVCLSLFALTDAARYKARFVKLVFDVDVFAFACNFRIFGGSLRGDELPVIAVCDEVRHVGMRKREDGYSSTVIIYHGYWDSTMNYGEKFVKNTVNDLIPYVGYIDENGNITDTMFDSVVFLLLQSRSPSGGKTVFFGSGEHNATIKSDFDYFIENLFADGYNMDALNTAFGTVKSKLGLDVEAKLNVSVQLPYVYKTDMPFGDINGDGKDEIAVTLEQRTAIYEYYIDKIIAKFASKNYENIKLAGFYQGCEGVPVAMSEDEYKLFSAVNDAVHARGYKATWIPCFLGTGFWRWKELGFDFAYLQPNYMFSHWPKESLDEFADIIDKYGLGAEIELNHTSVNPSCAAFEKDSRKYLDYLDYGAKRGYMNAALAFYQGAGPGSMYNAAMSSDSRSRNIYDSTYRFIKEKYSPEKDNVREDTVMDNIATENINETATDAVNEAVTAEEACAAEVCDEITESSVNADECCEQAAEGNKKSAELKDAALKAAAQAKAKAVKAAGQLKAKAAAAGSATSVKAKAAAAAIKDKTAAAREIAGVKAAAAKKKTVETAGKAVAGGKVAIAKAKSAPETQKMAVIGAVMAFAAVVCALADSSNKEDK